MDSGSPYQSSTGENIRMKRIASLRAAASSKGGKIAAQRMTEQQRIDRATKGGIGTLKAYGSSYYASIRRKAKPE